MYVKMLMWLSLYIMIFLLYFQIILKNEQKMKINKKYTVSDSLKSHIFCMLADVSQQTLKLQQFLKLSFWKLMSVSIYTKEILLKHLVFL